MASYKDRGIVVRRDNFGEADRCLTIYARRRGKISILAKGSRRPTAKLTGAVNLLNEIEFVAAEGRNLDILTEAQIVTAHGALSRQLAKTKIAYWFCELIDKLVHDEEAHPRLYDFLSQSLRALNNYASDLLLSHFIYNSLSELGYRPEIKKCAQCGKPLNGNARMYFSPASGGVVSGSCAPAGGRVIKTDTIKAMRLLDAPLAQVSPLKISPVIRKELESHLKDFVEFIAQKSIRSEEL